MPDEPGAEAWRKLAKEKLKERGEKLYGKKTSDWKEKLEALVGKDDKASSTEAESEELRDLGRQLDAAIQADKDGIQRRIQAYKEKKATTSLRPVAEQPDIEVRTVGPARLAAVQPEDLTKLKMADGTVHDIFDAEPAEPAGPNTSTPDWHPSGPRSDCMGLSPWLISIWLYTGWRNRFVVGSRVNAGSNRS